MSFKPGKYLSEKYSSTSKSQSKFTLKGKSSSSIPALSEDELIQLIERLKDSEYMPLKKLRGTLKTDFDTIIQYIGLVRNTNSYGLLLDLINDQFAKETPSDLTPGTIGAYFRGSNLNIKFDPVECSALGAGAMPKDEEDWKECKNTVILASRTGSGYDFSLLKSGADASHAYIHVNHDNYEDFKGFSSDEKKKLRKYGVEYVYLHGYGSNDASQQKDLIGSAKHIDELKHRKCSNCEVSNDSNSGGFNWIALVIFIIILIIIIALLQLVWE